jgi:hypothetical protein
MASRSLLDSLPVESSAVNTAEAEIVGPLEDEPFRIEIPGRGIHPGKLTAMLRTNFGISAYRVTVSLFCLTWKIID